MEDSSLTLPFKKTNLKKQKNGHTLTQDFFLAWEQRKAPGLGTNCLPSLVLPCPLRFLLREQGDGNSLRIRITEASTCRQSQAKRKAACPGTSLLLQPHTPTEDTPALACPPAPATEPRGNTQVPFFMRFNPDFPNFYLYISHPRDGALNGEL